MNPVPFDDTGMMPGQRVLVTDRQEDAHKKKLLGRALLARVVDREATDRNSEWRDAVALQYGEVGPSGTYEVEMLVIKSIVYGDGGVGINTQARPEKNTLKNGVWYVSELRGGDVCDYEELDGDLDDLDLRGSG